MEYVLQTNSLCKSYSHFNVLNGLTMNVPKGAIYGFVGRNGAGKTTLFRLICGLQTPTNGEYELYGVKNSDSDISKSRRRIGAVIESPSLFPEMTAEENLKYQYRLLGMPNYKGIGDLLTLVGLDATGAKKAKNFSLGMRQRLGIAIALCGEQDLLILDEPINGLDPQGIIEMRELILKLNKERNITFVISSHILDELSKIATHYGFISDGRIVREMSAEELTANCRKSLNVTVTNTEMLSVVLDEMGIEYAITDHQTADIYASPNISELVFALSKRDCQLLSCSMREETLEGFFISLVGGGKDE